jgi:leukotriene-A4 hydrolase
VERGLQGTWVASGVNPVFLFTRYGPGGHFSPHTDGNTVQDLNQRSLYSVLVYLNTCEVGGDTTLFAPPPEAHPDAQRVFLRDTGNRLRWPADWAADSAPPIEGNVLLFRQDAPHEGSPVGQGCEKLIIRTDIMFERTPAACDDDAGRAAYALWREANSAEEKGEAMQAMALFRKSARTSPALADLMGL